jgi:hypothetical protein
MAVGDGGRFGGEVERIVDHQSDRGDPHHAATAFRVVDRGVDAALHSGLQRRQAGVAGSAAMAQVGNGDEPPVVDPVGVDSWRSLGVEPAQIRLVDDRRGMA